MNAHATRPMGARVKCLHCLHTYPTAQAYIGHMCVPPAPPGRITVLRRKLARFIHPG